MKKEKENTSWWLAARHLGQCLFTSRRKTNQLESQKILRELLLLLLFYRILVLQDWQVSASCKIVSRKENLFKKKIEENTLQRLAAGNLAEWSMWQCLFTSKWKINQVELPVCVSTISISNLRDRFSEILSFRETTSRYVPALRSGTDFSSADSAGKDRARTIYKAPRMASRCPSTSDIRPAIVIARQGIENASDIFFSPHRLVEFDEQSHYGHFPLRASGNEGRQERLTFLTHWRCNYSRNVLPRKCEL